MKTLLAAILALLAAPLSTRAEMPLRIAVVSRTTRSPSRRSRT